jgi:pyruvate-formate lyase-activating enzyme
MLAREAVANRPKHWVRLVTACNSRCLFCLDSDTPRNVFLPFEEIEADLEKGRRELDAWKVIVSGGEASLHPRFHDVVRRARELGYGRVQTVTNGWRYAEKEFFDDAVAAGLDEITFSLHGHDEALHDHMTQHPGAFRNIVKAIARSIRSGKVITSIDVCINKQNVSVLDKIVELGFSLGVTEYDLLHVIPQAAAFDHRDELFYDPREHLPMLHKVFSLNRHPSFVIWTNRFPVSYLEGLEDLIQDPHKMLDEVNGRRFQVRRYLDAGDALDCRQPERCVHCFIEPFCTTMDRVIEKQRAASYEIWDAEGRAVDPALPLPFGASLLAVTVPHVADVDGVARPAGAGAYVRTVDASPLPSSAERRVYVAETAAQLDAWLASSLPDRADVDVVVSCATEDAIRRHAATLASLGDRARLVWPTHAHMAEAHEHDVRDPRAFVASLAPHGVRISGLPACLAPGATLLADRAIAEASMFDAATGRPDHRGLAQHHVARHYRGKSERCRDCAANDHCDGAHINLIRDQGLAQLTPLAPEDPMLAEVHRLQPEPISRLSNGRPLEAIAPSLPGFAMPTRFVKDPLALIAEEQMLRKAKKDVLKQRAAGGVRDGTT